MSPGSVATSSQRIGEHIPLIVLPELFARDGERRARHASREEVDPLVVFAFEGADVAGDYLPVAAVLAERRARGLIDLDRGGVLESGGFQARRLTAAAGADFENPRSHRSIQPGSFHREASKKW